MRIPSLVISLLTVVSVSDARIHRYDDLPLPLDLPYGGRGVLPTEWPTETGRVKQEEVQYRLDLSVIPSNYHLTMKPYFDEVPDKSFTYEGNVVITAEVMRTNDTVTLHAHQSLNITSVSVVVLTTSEVLPVLNASHSNEGNEFFVISLAADLVSGQTVRITMDFEGKLLDDLQGFFRSSYEEDGQVKWLAVTDMEQTFARKAFPCFDEPALKASFTVTLSVPQGFSARANSDVDGPPSEEGDRTIFRFKPTPRMSTYLVAFLVSQMSGTLAPGSQPSFRVWSRPATEAQRKFATRVGPQLIRELGNYTAFAYPMTKIDSVVPPDIVPGGMENWGMITFREWVLLVDGQQTPSSFLKNVGTTLAHEYAHQWFGDLVSPLWWSNTWLNEGFANFFQYYALSWVEPNWRLMDLQALEGVQFALIADSTLASTPLTFKDEDVNTPTEIAATYGRITYYKGGAFLRMMFHVLGEETFKRGIQRYIAEMKYSSATELDLIRALNAEADQDVLGGHTLQEIVMSWTNTHGFPLLTVERNYTENTTRITQERYLSSGATTDPPEWIVPINWATTSDDFLDTAPVLWLNKSEEVNLGNISSDDWIILNKQKYLLMCVPGFYRVDYDPQNWDLIVDQLNKNHSLIHLVNQAQLIDDAFALAKTGGNYTVALELTRFLRNQQEFIPWSAALSGLTFIRDRLNSSDYARDFKAYILNLMSPLYERFGSFAMIVPATLQEDLLQNTILTWVCQLGDERCAITALEIYGNSTTVPVAADVRSVVYCEVVKAGDADVWQEFWTLFTTTDIATEKIVLLSALACSRDANVLTSYLDLARTPGSGIRSQDAVLVLSFVATNLQAFDIVLDYVRNKIQSPEPGDVTSLLVLLMTAATKVSTTEQAAEAVSVAQLFGVEQVVQQSTDSILLWLEKNEEIVGQWFRNNIGLPFKYT